MVSACSGPSKPPTGPSTLAALMAVFTSWPASPAAASAAGSSCTRTAGFSAPFACTCATPGTWLSRCTRMVSAASYTAASGRLLLVSAMVMIGASAGLNLRK